MLYNDDSPMRILKFTPETLAANAGKNRAGIFTAGVVAETSTGPIALFKTGQTHAGPVSQRCQPAACRISPICSFAESTR